MTSPAQICNDGLVLIGEGRVNSSFLTAPVGELERLCEEQYPRQRDAMLRENIWTFAKTRASLAAHSTAPLFEWDRAFTVPGDFLRLVSLDAGKDWVPLLGVDYTMGQHPAPTQLATGETATRTILTNYDAPLKTVYIRKVTDVDDMDILFQTALGARIAMQLAPRIAEDSNAFTRARSVYQLSLDEADRVNAMEMPPITHEEDDFITVRA